MSKSRLASFIVAFVFNVAHAGQALQSVADPAHGRRWELDWDAVYVYDAASGNLVRRIKLPGVIFSGAPDAGSPALLLTSSGGAIVSSNACPRLWRIGPTYFEVEPLDLAVDTVKDFGFTTLAWADENRGVLHATATSSAGTWRIDLRSATALPLGSARIVGHATNQ